MIFFCCMATDCQIKERRVRSRRPTHLVTQFNGLILVEFVNFVKSRLFWKKRGCYDKNSYLKQRSHDSKA
jgi:hypothetical protein